MPVVKLVGGNTSIPIVEVIGLGFTGGAVNNNLTQQEKAFLALLQGRVFRTHIQEGVATEVAIKDDS